MVLCTIGPKKCCFFNADTVGPSTFSDCDRMIGPIFRTGSALVADIEPSDLLEEG